MLDKADGLYKREQALRDVQAKVFKNPNIVSGNTAAGTPETVNVDSAVKALQKLQDSTRYGGSRLEQAFGKDGAKAMLDDLYAAQRAGQKAIPRAAMARTIGKYLGRGALLAAGGGLLGGAAYDLLK
jgi:hypothetical protein